MERRKHRRSNLDELAIVKAAAWSWYQHGSGAEGRPMREYDLSKTQKPPKPSRYKLEAALRDYYVQEQEDLKKQMSSPNLMSPLSSNTAGENSLLDTYEIERISRELHSYIESSRRTDSTEHLKSFLGGDNDSKGAGNRKVVSLSESGTSEKRSKPKHKILKGFWPAVCGSGHRDVVEALVGGGRKNCFEGSSRRQENQNVPVVKNSSRLRRGVHAE